MHQPVYQVALVMAAFFGFGFFFLYSAAWSEASQVVIKGFETGYALPVWVWRLSFVGLGLVMTGAGVFILLGLLRGNKPFVRIEKRRIVVVVSQWWRTARCAGTKSPRQADRASWAARR